MIPPPNSSWRTCGTAHGIAENVGRVLVGKPDAVRTALVTLLAEGHLLVEDVPGVGKTSLAKALARSVDCTVSRIQFTPDLLPSDITGVSIYNRTTTGFEFRAGPVFANIVIGDEINRASPKTQSALLECMEERQVTVDGHSYPLADPFTSLRGQLDRGDPVDLFRVRGLTDRAYLRALTLSTFRDGQGWLRGPLDGAAPVDGAVPLPPGLTAPLPGPVVEVQIEPIDYVDTWLPAFGVPLGFRGIGAGWRYDPNALTAFSGQRQRAAPTRCSRCSPSRTRRCCARRLRARRTTAGSSSTPAGWIRGWANSLRSSLPERRHRSTQRSR